MQHNEVTDRPRMTPAPPMAAFMSCALLFAITLLIVGSILVKQVETFACSAEARPVSVSSWLWNVCSVGTVTPSLQEPVAQRAALPAQGGTRLVLIK